MSAAAGPDGEDGGAVSAARTADVESASLRRTFSCFATGVTAVAALADGQPRGMAVNSFASVSLDPPLVSFCIAESSTTWPALSQASALGISVLADSQHVLAKQLAGSASQRFDRSEWDVVGGEALVARNAAAWLRCTVASVVAAGDHRVIIARVLDHDGDPGKKPLVFHGRRFRALHDDAEAVAASGGRAQSAGSRGVPLRSENVIALTSVPPAGGTR